MFLKPFARYETDVLCFVHLSSTIPCKIKVALQEETMEKLTYKSIQQSDTGFSGLGAIGRLPTSPGNWTTFFKGLCQIQSSLLHFVPRCYCLTWDCQHRECLGDLYSGFKSKQNTNVLCRIQTQLLPHNIYIGVALNDIQSQVFVPQSQDAFQIKTGEEYLTFFMWTINSYFTAAQNFFCTFPNFIFILWP